MYCTVYYPNKILILYVLYTHCTLSQKINYIAAYKVQTHRLVYAPHTIDISICTKTGIYRCNRSSCDRHGYYIEIIFLGQCMNSMLYVRWAEDAVVTHLKANIMPNTAHCPKNIRILSIQIEHATARAEAYAWPLFTNNWPRNLTYSIYHCICSSRDRLGFSCGDSA